MKNFLMMMTILVLLISIVACQKTNKTENTGTTTTEEKNDTEHSLLDRLHPSYYEEGIPMVENAHVIYINWDGFGRYYYDELVKNAVDEEMPTLKKILSEGVFFENLRTTLPSITNPLQNMILSGSTSSVTKNVYRYYNKNTDTVIQQARENANKTIADVAVEEGLSVASISHYLLEPVLTKGYPNTYYITSDSSLPSVVARGPLRTNDHFARFEQLIRLMKKEAVNVGGVKKVVSELPNLIVFYADDLDAIGHNFEDHYGYHKTDNEEDRMKNVLSLLKQMDQKLGEFIQAAKDAGVYDKITFFLTTDHGMNPYGLTSIDGTSDYGTSKLGELQSFFKNFNRNYTLEMVAADKKPKPSTTVVGVGANLNLQLTFKNGITDAEMEAIKTELEKEYYVGKVLTRKELDAIGYMEGAADMVISPAERYFFSSNMLSQFYARGQHDSLEDCANRIYGAIWGKGIKKNYLYEGEAYNFDFGTTMAAALGVVIPNANGVVLDVFDKE